MERNCDYSLHFAYPTFLSSGSFVLRLDHFFPIFLCFCCSSNAPNIFCSQHQHCYRRCLLRRKPASVQRGGRGETAHRGLSNLRQRERHKDIFSRDGHHIVACLAETNPKNPNTTTILSCASRVLDVPIRDPPRRLEASMDTEARLLREIGEGSQENMENITLVQQFSTIDELSTR